MLIVELRKNQFEVLFESRNPVGGKTLDKVKDPCSMNLLLISIILGIGFGIVTTIHSAFGDEEWNIYQVNGGSVLNNQTFKIPYRIINGTLDTIKVDAPAGSLTVTIKSQGEGLFEISIPRNLIDAKFGEQDDSFFVLVDGEEIKYTELGKTECSRTLSTTFSMGAEEIEIIKTMIDGLPRPVLPIYCTKPSLKGQMESGISSDKIICKEGLQLIFKSKDNSPACVKPETAEKLVKRGWGTKIFVTSIEPQGKSTDLVINNTPCIGTQQCLIGKVNRIIDGDTLEVNGVKIRLSLVNTPEKNEEGFSEATDFTTSLCPINSTAIVDQDDGQPYDVYDRMMAKVKCGNTILNSELLSSEHAYILKQFCSKSEFSGENWAKKYGC